MSKRPTSFIERRAPYVFCAALISTLILFFWTRPTIAIFAVSAATGLVIFLVQRFVPRVQGVDMVFLPIFGVLVAGSFVTKNGGMVMVLYASLFFLTVSGLHCLAVRRVHDA